jgi:hypothetical protein
MNALKLFFILVFFSAACLSMNDYVEDDSDTESEDITKQVPKECFVEKTVTVTETLKTSVYTITEKTVTTTVTNTKIGNIPPKSNKKRGRGVLPKGATEILKAWLEKNLDNPFPTAYEKEKLSKTTRLTLKQITNWFTNARRPERFKKFKAKLLKQDSQEPRARPKENLKKRKTEHEQELENLAIEGLISLSRMFVCNKDESYPINIAN